MTFKTYWLSLDKTARSHLAARCATTYVQLRHVAYGRKPGESLAINIERETRGAVRCEDLRPDVDWQYIRGTAVS